MTNPTETVTKIEITLHTPELLDFLHDCADPEAAAEEYRAEYERRLTKEYQCADVSVKLNETDRIYVEPESEQEDAIPWIQDVTSGMVTDWSWSTIPAR
jgi:hypothetical protein